MSDESGEYEIYLKDCSDNNVIKQLISNGIIWCFILIWLFDSLKLLFVDKNYIFWWIDVKLGKQYKIDISIYDEEGICQYIWLLNSEDIVYVKNNENCYVLLWYYNIDKKKVICLMDEMINE